MCLRWLQTHRNLIRSHRKCAFHLPFLQVASVRLVTDTSFLADNTWGLNQHFPPVKLFPLFCINITVDLTPQIYLQLSIKLIWTCTDVKQGSFSSPVPQTALAKQHSTSNCQWEGMKHFLQLQPPLGSWEFVA